MREGNAAARQQHFENTVFIPAIEDALENGDIDQGLREHLREALRVAKAGRNVEQYGLLYITQVMTVALLELRFRVEALGEISGVGASTIDKIRETNAAARNSYDGPGVR